MTTASSPRSGGPGQHQKPLVVEEYNPNMGGVDTGKKIYNNIYISPFCYARLTLSPQQYRTPAGVLLRVLPPDHQVVEEALPPDRHGHRQRLHSVFGHEREMTSPSSRLGVVSVVTVSASCSCRQRLKRSSRSLEHDYFRDAIIAQLYCIILVICWQGFI